MKRTMMWVGLLAAVVLSGGAEAANVVTGDEFSLDARGRMQWLGVAQHLDDDVRNDGRLYLFMKQARLRFTGRYDDTKFDVHWAYGGEDVVAVNPGVALSLLDFSFDVPFILDTRVKIGQFRVPYGRERLTDAGTLNFGDRSIQSPGFHWNRDVGVALHTYRGKFAGAAGIFTGGGRSVPQRYLPEILGIPMVVARLGYNDGVDEDIFNVRARERQVDRTKKAVFVNALYLKDSLVGHSTVLNVRSTDKSLLINSNWNPFITRAPLSQGEVWQAGGDAVIRTPLAGGTLTAEAEANYARFENPHGALALKGGRVQVGLSKGAVEMNLRYARLYPDKRMANTYTPAGTTTPANTLLAPDGKPMQELTPSLTYHYRKNVAVVMDLPILIDMLVFKEGNLGGYVATEQPDQASVVKPGAFPGSVTRETVPEARLMIQFTF
jgi:hypothetical protein